MFSGLREFDEALRVVWRREAAALAIYRSQPGNPGVAHPAEEGREERSGRTRMVRGGFPRQGENQESKTFPWKKKKKGKNSGTNVLGKKTGQQPAWLRIEF